MLVRSVSSVVVVALLACGACSSGDEVNGGQPPRADAGSDAPASVEDDGGPLAACDGTAVTDKATAPLASASTAEEYALNVEARSAAETSWAKKGSEAVVLEVLRGTELVGHLVLHQGLDPFTYGMHVGALAAGEALTVRVSPLTAPKARKGACITKATLTPASQLGNMADGVVHAPIVKWPTQKSFDDLPVLLGWSRTGKSYQLTYTNENGGTCALCGGGATGVRSEIARWGRALDMEGVYGYGAPGHFERCTGSVPPAAGAPRMDALHPILYYGDGHNRIYESRGGYGKDCGTGADKTPNGDLDGWNANNPSSDLKNDGPFTIVLRPLPVDMDAVGANKLSGRREAIVDTYAPWLYRLTDSELAREGKIDNKQTFPMARYLLVDVYAADVNGSGDTTCGPVPFAPQISATASSGFVLRAISKSGTVSNGPQMTADYFGGANNVKRIAIPLASGVSAADITKFRFDAYDGDGIYFLAIGDAFSPVAKGTNGASLEYAHKGVKAVNVYVDDGKGGCVNDKNTSNGVVYPCVGGQYELTP